MSDLKMTHEVENGVTVCRIDGRMDGLGAAVVEPYVQQRLSAGEARLVLDLGGVDYISSAGLRCLLVVAKKVQSVNGSLVVCDLGPLVLKIITMSGFQQLLKICATRQEAVAAITGAQV